jgi:hypothetical protein
MQKTLLLLACAVLISCGKSAPPPGPADVITATYKALEAQDSAAFLATLSQDKLDECAINPGRTDSILNHWKGRHAEVKVLSIKQNDTSATIVYNLTITGNNPATHDSIMARVYLENGIWKHGY